VKTWFQSLLSKRNLHRYNAASAEAAAAAAAEAVAGAYPPPPDFDHSLAALDGGLGLTAGLYKFANPADP
jgi:hypothetical protein